jgi:hypothetical protein
VRSLTHNLFLIFFLAAFQYSAFSQEQKGKIASAPDLETGNVYCEIQKPDSERKYYVFRDSKRMAELEIIRTVGDFGAVARLVPKHATSLVHVGDAIYDTSVLVPPEVIQEAQTSAAALPPLHPITAMPLQPMPTPSPTPALAPPAGAPTVPLAAVFGQPPLSPEPVLPVPTPQITGYDLRLVEPQELLNGTYTVSVVPGDWYTVPLRVSYATPPNTVLVAEILPDAEEAAKEIQTLSGDAQRSRLEQFYKTVHFDTQNAPGFENLEGNGILSFSVKGHIAPQATETTKTVRITLHSLPDWETKFQTTFTFSVQPKSPSQ